MKNAPRVTSYRRSPFLLSYWERGQLVFENFATCRRISASPLTATILDFFDRWRSAEKLFSQFWEFTPASLRRAISQLLRHSLLQRSDRPENSTERALRAWRSWNPSAGFFHLATKDVGLEEDQATSYRSLVRQARRSPMPLPIKRYKRVRKFSLPRARADSELSRVLLERRTWRRFAPVAVGLADLSTLLDLTWGIQRWERVPGLGRAALKTSPSGGALHPIEAYVMARHVKGLPAGLYHYAADTHSLELLRKGATSRQMARYLARQRWYGSAAVLVLMTAVFSRPLWKYNHARAYRAVLIDAGHLCQTFCLVATSLGLAPFCSMALADSLIEKDLGVDGVGESVVYAAGVGARPPNTHWAPAPAKRFAPWWPGVQ